MDVRLERRAAERIITLEHNSHVLGLDEVATFEGGGHLEALGLVVYTFRNILGNERLSIDFHLIPYFGEHSPRCLEVFLLEFLVDGLSVV